MLEIDELKRRFRALREAHQLTQHDAAAIAGLDYKFYQYIESPRKKQIWLETVARIAAVYRMELWQLLHPEFLKYARKPRPMAKN